MQETIESFISFIEHTDKISSSNELVIFRGQAQKGNLLPGIARKDNKENTTKEEKTVLEQLELQGASLLNSNVGTTKLDLMILAQHYGLKTRLLDWTSNPLAALWFACSDFRDGDAYIYALEADSFLDKRPYDKDPFSTAKTRVVQPRLNNPRIISQEGWFTLHRYSSKTNSFVPLEKNTEIKEHIHCFKVPAKHRQTILKSLDKHGISARTLFPDLEGLCKHLNMRHALI